MFDAAVSRRRFLKGGGLLVGTLAFAGGPIAMLAPTRTWALEVKALNEHQGRTLLVFTRHLYPHDTLEDAVYALVVKDLDDKAQQDPAMQRQLTAGVARLDAIAGGSWLDRKPNMQDIDVESMAGTPFFETVRSTAVVSLYNNDMAFAHFGYGGREGDGGYLYKGFNDLSWVPAPPAAASGPVPGKSS